MVITLLATVMVVDIIKPVDPTFRTVPSHIQGSDRYWPHFKGCISAIDGVHVPMVLPLEEQHPYKGRKGSTTINCMVPYEVRVYLVDLEYHMKRGFLAPYKGERYHIPNFQRGSQLHCLEERFNYLHSSLLSVIERTFGVWKNKWKILRNMPAFHKRTQNYIIVATMVLHNFISAHDQNDVEHRHSAQGACGSSEGCHYDGVADVVSYLDEAAMKEVQNNITASICMDHN
ncbi:hypothetical protein SO802_007114 [Lithocarpus litseifolius]|uniref:DDE Tnp4 domain-containing protein n=1 Tax=Lithocarpus litseifolius TaxID=425828 RepID=A0AAW2DTE8_9ROSI